ncbi:MAG TPA: aminotransferase class III-fold pyridoxal phosphate-dependent enzyme [Conexibacter sp.]|nr:aminotransferase class III-fold pyridoxal phosphate-dependent enzyme [Conexibacter sp.]
MSIAGSSDAERAAAESLRRLTERTARSGELHRSSAELLPMVATGTLKVPYPIYVASARGARVVDVDGNEFIDLTMGFGPHILGHASPLVTDAVREAVGRGLQFALHSPYQEPLARLVCDAHPANEMVLFCNSGTEATMHAIRLARAFSGRTTIAMFEGSYHGAHDYAMVTADPASPADAPLPLGRGAGVTAEAVSTVAMLPYWSDAAFDAIRARKDELAAVLVEPVQGSNPQTEHADWLRELRAVCSEAGVLLLVDEVLSGFRLGYGGAQGTFDVAGDLVTYGKVIGGGLPIGAIAGRRDVMELFAPEAGARQVFSTGTFSGNPMSMAAGAAVLGRLLAHPEDYKHLERQSRRLVDAFDAFCAEHGLPAHVQRAGSIMFLRLQRAATPLRTARDVAAATAAPAVHDAFQLKLLERGVILPGIHQFHLSTAHTAQDVDSVIAACEEALLELAHEGWPDAPDA